MSYKKTAILNTGLQQGVSKYYTNFTTELHIETKKERSLIPEIVSGYKIADFSFKYQSYVPAYEDYIQNNSQLLEEKLISFFDVVRYQKQEKTDFRKLFNENLNEFIKTRDARKNYIFDRLDDYEDFFSVQKSRNIKLSLPYFGGINFDKISGNIPALTDILDKYNVKTKLLQKFYDSSVSILKVSNDFLISTGISTDPNFFVRLGTLKNNYSLTSQQMINGSTTPFEIIGYRISKYYGSSGFKYPVQEWIIPDSSLQNIQLVDTQIKYGKNYYYKIALIIATIGSVYDLDTDGIPKNVQTELFITQTDSTGYEGRLLANPPVSPESLFLPLVDVPDKIKIYFNNRIERLFENPVIILPEDARYYNDARGADFYKDGIVRYQTLSEKNRIQIFRLDEEPYNISDFSKAKISLTPEDLDFFEDTIEPNKKYYYIFRSIDIHNHASNPTKIYTVEIKEEGGRTYPIFGVHEMTTKKDSLKEAIKGFRKFFSVAPQVNHIIPNENNELNNLTETEILDKVEVGISKPSIWGKNFKIRLTSRNSGKKIDFNISFKKNLIK